MPLRPSGNPQPNSDSACTAIKPASWGQVCSSEPPATRGGETGDVRIPGFCASTARQPGEGVSGLVADRIAKRVNRTLKRVDEVLRKRWHHDIWERRVAGQVCNGWLNYFALPDQAGMSADHRPQAATPCHRWALRRRSQRYALQLEAVGTHDGASLATVSIRHPWPDQRFQSPELRSRMV